MEGQRQEKGAHERLGRGFPLSKKSGEEKAAAGTGVRDQARAGGSLTQAAAKTEQNKKFKGQDSQGKLQQDPVKGLLFEPGQHLDPGAV